MTGFIGTLIASALPAANSIDYFIIAGGGGGGIDGGGGGGAGGVLVTSSQAIDPSQTLTITVGAGGAISSDGNNSSITNLGASSPYSTATAYKGGAGGNLGVSGGGGNGTYGSGGGGGAGYSPTIPQGFGGANTPGQGNIGGNGGLIAAPNDMKYLCGGGGGGGSISAPAGAGDDGASFVGGGAGDGGLYREVFLTPGSITQAAAGGGGGGWIYGLASGFNQGSGYAPNSPFTASSGTLAGNGGGGGSQNQGAAAGKDGVVYIRYSANFRPATVTGTVTYSLLTSTSPPKRLYTFTGNGTFKP